MTLQNVFGSLALDATLTGGTQKTKLVDSAGVLVATVTATGALKIDGSAAIQPVSGTVTVNAGTGPFAISAASLPLPTLAATSTKQSDGSQKSQVVDGSGNVIGATSNALDVNIKSGASSGTEYTEDAASAANPVGGMLIGRRRDTPVITEVSAEGDNIALITTSKGELYVKHIDSIPVTNTGTFVVQATEAILDAAIISQEATTSGVKGITSFGAVTTNAPSYTTVKSDALSLTPAGGLRIDLKDTAANTTALNVSLAAETTKVIGTINIASAQTLATVTTVSTVTNLSQLGGIAIAMNTGTRSTGTQRVTIATDDIVPASQSGTWTVQPGNTANTTAWLTSAVPGTAGGLTTYHLASAGTTNLTVVKNGAGQLYGWYIYNSNAAARKLAFHDTASTPTAGASIFFSLVIPPTSGANISFSNGIVFATGIAISTVTGLADNDTAAVAANDLIINLYYK